MVSRCSMMLEHPCKFGYEIKRYNGLIGPLMPKLDKL